MITSPGGEFDITLQMTIDELTEYAENNWGFRILSKSGDGTWDFHQEVNYEITDIIISEAGNPGNIVYDMKADPNLNNGFNTKFLRMTDMGSITVLGTPGSRILEIHDRTAGWAGIEINPKALGVHSFLAAHPNATGTPWGEEIAKGTVVRAAVFDSDGNRLTPVKTNVYYVDIDKGNRYPNMPVISITTDAYNLFDWYDGIYTGGVGQIPCRGNWSACTPDNPCPSWIQGCPLSDDPLDICLLPACCPNCYKNANYNQRGAEWERPAHMTFIETDGSVVLSQDIGIRIHGGASRRVDQKSLRLYARGSVSSFNHDIFDGIAFDAFGEPITQFQRLLLRNTGNDFNIARMRCSLLTARAHDLNMVYQFTRPAVVFVNGEFWGHYEIRERVDERFIANNFGVRRQDVAYSEIIGDRYLAAEDGEDDVTQAVLDDEEKYHDMLEFFSEIYDDGNGTMTPSEYAEAQRYLDIDNFIDYWAFEMAVGNGDWPQNNTRIWRYRADAYPATIPNEDKDYEDGRWRYILLDLDFAYALYGDNSDHWADTINRLLDRDPDDTETLILRTLMTNKKFRERFIIRSMDLMNTNLRPEVLKEEMEKLADSIKPVMEEHSKRWIDSNWNWEYNAYDRLPSLADIRQDMYLEMMEEYFGLGGIATLSIKVEGEEYGSLIVNTIDLANKKDGVEDPADWNGKYLIGTTQTITAVPVTGRKLESLSINGVPYEAR